MEFRVVNLFPLHGRDEDRKIGDRSAHVFTVEVGELEERSPSGFMSLCYKGVWSIQTLLKKSAFGYLYTHPKNEN